MAIPAVRRAFVFCILGSLYYALGQTAPTDLPTPKDRPDPAMYEQFFRQVAELKVLSNSAHLVPFVLPVVSNGEAQPPAIERRPIAVEKIQDIIGVSFADVIVLNAAAADCVAKLDSLQQTARPLIFESRLQSAESGKISDAVTQKLKDLDDRHNQIVLDHVQHLKAALPDSSYEKLDAYVRAPPEGKRPLSPVFGPRPVTQAAPK